MTEILRGRRGRYFNPRFPRGKRHSSVRGIPEAHRISIHASRGGSDRASFWKWRCRKRFQSTLPAGEATLFCRSLTSGQPFQSTLPAGEATTALLKQTQNFGFQSTLPAGEATHRHCPPKTWQDISIHASRGGSDCAVKLSPNYRTWRHGLREPGFHRFFYRRFPCFFLLGAWGSRL